MQLPFEVSFDFYTREGRYAVLGAGAPEGPWLDLVFLGHELVDVAP